MYRKLHSFIKSSFFRNSAIAFSCVIAMLSLILNMCHNNQINDMRYLIQATELKPILIVDTPPKIFELRAYIDTINDSEKMVVFLEDLTTSIPIKNIGQKTADIRGHFYASSHGGNDLLRNFLLDGKTILGISQVRENSFYKEKLILPGETKELKFRGIISDIKRNEFIQHHLILFKNEAGMLYDIYIWYRYSFKQVACSSKDIEENGNYQLKIFSKITNSCNAIEIELVDSNTSTHVYNQKELLSIRKTIDINIVKGDHPFDVWYKFEDHQDDYVILVDSETNDRKNNDGVMD